MFGIAILLVAGLALLGLGGELLVRGASKLAISTGLSPLVVGLTVVAFGTSAPELAVSVQAVVEGQTDIAMGNVVGSNVFNVLVLLGLSALVTPLTVTAQIVRQEVPVMIAVSFLLYGFAVNGTISRVEGVVLFSLLVIYTFVLVRQSRRESQGVGAEYGKERHVAAKSWADTMLGQGALIAAGLALLVLGARWLVEGATDIARSLGVSELVIGLTIVAAGTSLPEVAASVTAVLRGQRDIAIGNAVGSNTFNILSVLGLSAMVAPAPLLVSSDLLEFDLAVMVGAAMVTLPICVTGQVARWQGGLLLMYYASYTTYLVLDAQESGVPSTFGWVIRSLVVPISVFVILVAAVRSRGRHARN
ncbi:MAG: calcium/sodium antiporter [Deltaproteobacteria bacterium]|nr:calcium/sodium antiporter [Deltaproteobacteria bacterium]